MDLLNTRFDVTGRERTLNLPFDIFIEATETLLTHINTSTYMKKP